MGDELHSTSLRHTIALAGRDRTVCLRNIIHSLLLQLWMRNAMSAIKESVSEMQGGVWWDGNRYESRAERGSYSCSLAFPPNQVCFIPGSLSLPRHLSFSTIISSHCNASFPFPLLSLFPHSVSFSSGPYSVRFSTVKMQLLTAHHLGLDHHPPHCIEGLLGLVPLQIILFLFETKRTDPYSRYSGRRDWREEFGELKKTLFRQETSVWWKL